MLRLYMLLIVNNAYQILAQGANSSAATYVPTSYYLIHTGKTSLLPPMAAVFSLASASWMMPVSKLVCEIPARAVLFNLIWPILRSLSPSLPLSVDPLTYPPSLFFDSAVLSLLYFPCPSTLDFPLPHSLSYLYSRSLPPSTLSYMYTIYTCAPLSLSLLCFCSRWT
jgi:hypothetical protein